jgi:hypothetical protein
MEIMPQQSLSIPSYQLLCQKLSETSFTGRASISMMQPIAAQLNGTAPRKLQVQYC